MNTQHPKSKTRVLVVAFLLFVIMLPPFVGNYWTQILGDIGIYIILGIGLNMTGLYRHLNMLEKRGVLTSTWDTGEPGPANRKYSLTAAGKECLWRWVGTLGTQLSLIGRFMDAAHSVFPEAVLTKVVTPTLRKGGSSCRQETKSG